MAEWRYMTNWGSIAISEHEADEMQRWEYIACFPDGEALVGHYCEAVDNAKQKLALKLADIERVAKWKYGRERHD